MFHLGEAYYENAEFDAGRGIVTWSERKVETRAVEDPRRHGHLQLMAPQFRAAALAPAAQLGPRFPAAAARTSTRRGAGCAASAGCTSAS